MVRIAEIPLSPPCGFVLIGHLLIRSLGCFIVLMKKTLVKYTFSTALATRQYYEIEMKVRQILRDFITEVCKVVLIYVLK